MGVCGKLVTIGARRMFFSRLANERTKTLMTRIVMCSFLAGGDLVLESAVIVKVLLLPLLTYKLAKTDFCIFALSLLLNLSNAMDFSLHFLLSFLQRSRHSLKLVLEALQMPGLYLFGHTITLFLKNRCGPWQPKHLSPRPSLPQDP